MSDLTPRHQLVNMLSRCREQFALYAHSHRQKADPTSPRFAGHTGRADTLVKAAANEHMVEQIDALIGPPGTSKAPDYLAASE